MANRNTPLSRRRNGGFTLIEMLLVVAIIGVLISVSIPAVSNALEHTRCATDAANERAAKAAMAIGWASGEFTPDDKLAKDKNGVLLSNGDCIEYKYYASTGKITLSRGSDECYGKCSKHKDGRIVVWVCPECGQIFTMWKVPESYKADGTVEKWKSASYESHNTSNVDQIDNVQTQINNHPCFKSSSGG